MIALPRTRDFYASNWQILLTKQQPECGPADWRVHDAHVL